MSVKLSRFRSLWGLPGVVVFLALTLVLLGHVSLSPSIQDEEVARLPSAELILALVMISCCLCITAGLAIAGWRKKSPPSIDQPHQEQEGMNLIEQLDQRSLFFNDIILLMDENLRIIDVNDRALEAYGYTRDEILQLSISDIRSAKAPFSLDKIMRMLWERGSLLFESLHRRKDGSEFAAESSSRMIRVGDAFRIQCIVRDISDWKSAEHDFRSTLADMDRKLAERAAELDKAQRQVRLSLESIRESEKIYRALFDYAGDPILIYTINGRYREANHAAQERLGYSREELLNIGPVDISSADYARLVPERLQAILEQGYLVFDTVYVRKTGELLPMEVHSRVIELGGEKAIMSIARDTTGRKRLEDVLVQAREELEQRVEERTNQLATLNDQLRREISERGRTELALVETEQKYQNLFQESLNGFCLHEVVLGPDGTVEELLLLDANPAYAQMLGRPRDSIIGHKLSEVFSDRDPFWRERLTEAALHGEPAHFERYSQDLQKYMEISVFQTHQGQVAVVATDITDRKKAEIELAQSRQMLRLVLDNSPQRVFWKDRDSRFMGCNLAFAQDAGLESPEEIVGKTDYDLSWGEQAEAYRSDDKNVIQSGMPKLGYEEPQPRRDGSLRWIHTNKVPLRDQNGDIIGLLGTYEDITERKQAEFKNQQLAAIVSQAVEGFLVTDTRGIIEYVNPAYEKITGYTQSELLGQNPSILKSGRHPIGFYKNLWETVLSGNTWTGRMVNRKKDGTHFHEEATISPILNAKGDITHFVAAKRDITREIEMEVQLRQSQKLEAIGQLAGGIAHDFNNLLQVIMAYTEFAKTDLPEGSRSHEDLDRVINAAARGADLTRQMLAFSRRTDLTITSFDVRPQIKELVKMLERTIPASISISYTFEQDLPNVVADPSQIHQILLNLCINAKDAMSHGGRLILSAHQQTVTETECSNRPGFSSGHFTVIEVSDTGTGIQEEHLHHIFEPYFTTKPPGKGTGLGLASAYGIVRQHGGFIEVISQVGIGSTFRVYLPCQPKPAGTAEFSKESAPLPRGTETILIAEDQDDILNMLKRRMEKLGYSVLEAHNGREAIEIYETSRDKVQITLLDMQMPEMDGERSLEQIRRIRQDAKVIVASGFVDTDTRARLKALGANEVLQKPYQIEKLSAAIRTILDDRKDE